MNKCIGIILFVMTAIIFCGIAPATKPAAAEGTCYIQATNDDVFIKVFDLDRDGNMGNLVWEGRVNANQSVKITVPHGFFRYYYNAEPDVDQPLSGGFDRSCGDDQTVLVP